MFPILRPRNQHPAHGGLYAYHSGQVFFPGAQSQVFEPSFSLPLYSFNGNGVYAGAGPRPFQGPQVFAGNPKTTAGIGGIVAGQIAFQGLSDNENG